MALHESEHGKPDDDGGAQHAKGGEREDLPADLGQALEAKV